MGAVLGRLSGRRVGVVLAAGERIDVAGPAGRTQHGPKARGRACDFVSKRAPGVRGVGRVAPDRAPPESPEGPPGRKRRAGGVAGVRDSLMAMVSGSSVPGHAPEPTEVGFELPGVARRDPSRTLLYKRHAVRLRIECREARARVSSGKGRPAPPMPPHPPTPPHSSLPRPREPGIRARRTCADTPPGAGECADAHRSLPGAGGVPNGLGSGREPPPEGSQRVAAEYPRAVAWASSRKKIR